MKMYKPIILYLPELLVKKLDKYLNENPQSFKFNRMYFYYVIHHLTVMEIQFKKDDYFYLNREFLKTVTMSNIDRYIKILKNGEFIISDDNYSPGVKSLKYKINSKFTKGIVKLELEKDSNLSKKIIKNLYKKKAHYNRLEPYLRLMKDEFMKMEVDYKKAKKWVEINANDAQKLSYLISLNHLEDQRHRYFKRNKTNRRLDTNLTNLKSDLRQFIIGVYISIDLKNSQPFLLGILLDTIINNRDTLCCYLHDEYLTKTFGIKRIQRVLKIHQKQEKEDLVKFRMYSDAVLKGMLYDDFIHLYNGEISRKQIKEIMFKVLFSRNVVYTNYRKFIPYEEDKKIFESVFPLIYEIVKILKTKDHRILPIYLQRMESYLFIDRISKELVGNGIIPFTIHDSIIVKKEHQKKAVDIMNTVFKNQIGVVPSFEIKNLNNIFNPNINTTV